MTEKYKLSEQEEEIIKYFRQRAEQNANSLIDSNGLEFIEENRDGAYRLTALVHFASFDMRVYYYPILFPETEYLNYIDFSLKFSASEYKFSIYDIFNYFDISYRILLLIIFLRFVKTICPILSILQKEVMP